MKCSYKTKFISLFVIFGIITVGISCFLFYTFLKEWTKKDFLQNAKTIISLKSERVQEFIDSDIKDFETLKMTLGKTDIGKFHISDLSGNFIIFNGALKDLNPTQIININTIFPAIAEDILFADIYVGEDMYSQKVTTKNNQKFILIMQLNSELLKQKQAEILNATLYLILLILLISLPIGYFFAIIPDNLNKKLFDLNLSLAKRVENEVAKNREKDRVMFLQAKNASMGEMISMITHQWRQPLSSISAIASKIKLLIVLNKIDEKDLEKSTQEIINNSIFLSETIEDFKNFFKPNKNYETLFLKNIINESIKFSQHMLDINNITLSIKYDETISIKIVKNELIQVLMNIIKNSADQLLFKQSQREIKITTYKENSKAIIEIEDNAGGVEPDIINKIFLEYFTTKQDGTGLGLYMSKLITEKNLHAHLSVANSKAGAVFKISGIEIV